MSRRIPTLDLFSGLGGFAYALRDVCKPVAYCEIDPTCRSILMNCMKGERLDYAPMIEDVRLLDPSILSPRPRFITAGFPCTDISAANPKGLGISGERSGLVKHVFRIIDECQDIQGVFLENSPFIKHRGVQTLVEAFSERGFEVAMMQLSASDVGALHKRQRWWCLATKPNSTLKMSKKILPIDWSKEPCRRLCPRTAAKYKECNQTNGAYGNAIVPQCARAAYNCLLSSSDFEITHDRQPFTLRITDGNVVYIKHLWPTPTAQKWNQCRTLVKRCTTQMSNVVFCEEGTYREVGAGNYDRRLLDKDFVINPSFIGWLMGYPKDWHGSFCCKRSSSA